MGVKLYFVRLKLSYFIHDELKSIGLDRKKGIKYDGNFKILLLSIILSNY